MRGKHGSLTQAYNEIARGSFPIGRIRSRVHDIVVLPLEPAPRRRVTGDGGGVAILVGQARKRPVKGGVVLVDIRRNDEILTFEFRNCAKSIKLMLVSSCYLDFSFPGEGLILARGGDDNLVTILKTYGKPWKLMEEEN